MDDELRSLKKQVEEMRIIQEKHMELFQCILEASPGIKMEANSTIEEIDHILGRVKRECVQCGREYYDHSNIDGSWVRWCLFFGIFTEAALKDAKEPLIALRELEGEHNGERAFLKAEWLLDSANQVSGVELSVKVKSEKVPLTKIVKLDGLKLVGEPEVTSNPELGKYETSKSLPSLESKFDALVIEEPPTIEQHKVVGSAAGKILVKEVDRSIVQLNMDQRAQKGKFNNYVLNNLSVMNITDDTIIISSIRAEYFDGKEWKVVPKIFTGIYNEYNRGFNFGTDVLPIRLKSKDGKDFCHVGISVPIEVEGEPLKIFNNRRRLHKSVCSPLKIKYIFETPNELTAELIVEYVSPKISLPTRESLMKDWRVTEDQMKFELHCDNTVELERVFFFVYVDKSGRMVLRIKGHSQYFYLQKSSLSVILQKALVEDSDEYLWKNKLKTDGGSLVSIWLLVDREKSIFYALRVKIETPSGEANGSCFIPYDSME